MYFNQRHNIRTVFILFNDAQLNADGKTTDSIIYLDGSDYSNTFRSNTPIGSGFYEVDITKTTWFWLYVES